MTNSTGSMQVRSENFYSQAKLSEIDLLEKCLEACANLEIITDDDIFWLTLGARLSITLEKKSFN